MDYYRSNYQGVSLMNGLRQVVLQPVKQLNREHTEPVSLQNSNVKTKRKVIKSNRKPAETRNTQTGSTKL